MCLASLWKEISPKLDEWANSEFMTTIFAHADEARGTVGRKIGSNGTVGYFDLVNPPTN
jgi:hypothetical protein